MTLPLTSFWHRNDLISFRDRRPFVSPPMGKKKGFLFIGYYDYETVYFHLHTGAAVGTGMTSNRVRVQPKKDRSGHAQLLLSRGLGHFYNIFICHFLSWILLPRAAGPVCFGATMPLR